MFALNQKRAIHLLARAGDVARLNEIGESLSCCCIDEEAFDAFYAAENVQRIREVGERFLRQGYDEGLYGYELLQETPSRELLEAFARALITRAGFPHRMLKVVKAAGIRLPRTLLLEAAERYRRRIGDCTGALLEIADEGPPKSDEGGVRDE